MFLFTGFKTDHPSVVTLRLVSLQDQLLCTKHCLKYYESEVKCSEREPLDGASNSLITTFYIMMKSILAPLKRSGSCYWRQQNSSVRAASTVQQKPAGALRFGPTPVSEVLPTARKGKQSPTTWRRGGAAWGAFGSGP